MLSYSSIVIICLMYISQVSLESNNYSQAVEDLSKAVSIKVKSAPAGSRLVIFLTVFINQLFIIGLWLRRITSWESHIPGLVGFRT